MLAPSIGAFCFGTSALNAGDRRGRIPRLLGLEWGAVFVVGVLVFVFLG